MLENLYRELERLKTKAQNEYKFEKIKIDQTELEERAGQSQYLIDFRNIEVDQKWLEGLFKEYLLVLKRSKKKNREVVKKLEQALEKKDLDLQVLIKKVFCSDTEYLYTLAKKLALEAEDLYFLGLGLGRPIFELYARKLRERIDLDKWSKGLCPVCGSLPAMAYLRKDDGKRILWCQFCGTEWSFMRLKCPFCSNDDQKTLRYFFTDENVPQRVYVCDECKKYLKTIDQRKMENPEDLDLVWENLSTLSMDIVAQNEGFVSPYSESKTKKTGVIIQKTRLA